MISTFEFVITWLLLSIVSTQNHGGPKSFDCPMRQMALEFAQYIQPWISTKQLQDVADALNGAPEAKNCSVYIDKLPFHIHKNNNEQQQQQHIPIIYVGDHNGIDDGMSKASYHKPFKTLQFAVSYAQKKYGPNILKQIILKQGTYYLQNTIHFTANDNNLIITNYKNDKVEISGAIPLNCSWSLYKNGENNLNYYMCKVNKTITQIKGIRVNGTRGIRARYPNANPEYGFGSTLEPVKYLSAKQPTKPDFDILDDDPIRNETKDGYFMYYNIGIGGTCDNWTPPAGYWCATHPSHGGTYHITSGLQYNQQILPHTPYTDASHGIIQCWRTGHWASWMFEIENYDAKNMQILFGRGGFQGARGGSGEHFYVENIFDELDYPNEWFFNSSTNILYYRSNQTNKSPSNLIFEATKLKTLFNYTGNMSHPIQNITIKGIIFKDTEYTYLDDHGMPSGGDWGLERIGALYFEYINGLTIESNYFTRLDGNAISLNRYCRNVSIIKNEFVWNGDTCISAWGDTEGITFKDSKTEMGIDGTNGNQPRGLNISFNIAHEIGIWEKQSAFFFNAKSCENTLYGNIAYNMPRAAIEHNDGFGGGALLMKNLLFNTCRESGAHGPFNSWDRQPFVTKVNNGTPSTQRKYDEIKNNFIISNYEAKFGIDNDDGSCYYNSHDNFLVYGVVGLKGYTQSHDNHHYNNIYGYIDQVCFDMVQDHGGNTVDHINWFFNNTCILNIDLTHKSDYNYGNVLCTAPIDEWPKMNNNVIYVLNTSYINKIGLCNLTEKAFQNKYNTDLGTVIQSPINDSLIISQARTLLFV